MSKLFHNTFIVYNGTFYYLIDEWHYPIDFYFYFKDYNTSEIAIPANTYVKKYYNSYHDKCILRINSALLGNRTISHDDTIHGIDLQIDHYWYLRSIYK